MRDRIFGLFVVLAALASVSASAITLSITPVTDVSVLQTGDTVSFDLAYDATDVNDLIGGAFDLVYDSTALSLVDIQLITVGNPDFFRAPDELDGLLEGWGFGSFKLLPSQAELGRVTFSVLPTMGESTVLFGQDTTSVAGIWCGSSDLCGTRLNVDYDAVTLQRVPLPGAVWLLASGLLALGLRRRR